MRTNPDVAFAGRRLPEPSVGDLHVGPGTTARSPSRPTSSGNPAISVPVEQFDGLPVGMQIIGRHHEDALLLDLARIVERERPWPLVATGAPR